MTTTKKPPLIFRTSKEGLAEFRYATDVWFACMQPAERQEALEYAREAMTRVTFKPNAKPRKEI
jgi:hypothetical protein